MSESLVIGADKGMRSGEGLGVVSGVEEDVMSDGFNDTNEGRETGESSCYYA